MTHALDSFLRPGSIAFVGATERSVWTRFAFANLKHMGFGGRVHLINRKGGEVLGQSTATSAAAVGEAIDLALLMVPSETIADTFPDLRAAGIRNAVILSSGFAEAGAAGRAEQSSLLITARANGVRLLGPNCLGFVNFVDRTPVWTVPVRGGTAPGHVALISQSGALASQMSYFVQWQSMGLSYMVSTGNEADIDVAQALDYLIDDPSTRVISVFLESVRDPAAFATAALRALDAGKPIVVLKVGSSPITAQAAQAHTGSLVGDDRVFGAVCRRLGIVRVHSLEDLVITAELLARTGRLGKGGLGLVSLSGGLCEIAADRALVEGVDLPQLAPQTVASLTAELPEFGTPRNPLDVTGAAMLRPELFESTVDLMAKDPGFSVVVAVCDLPSGAADDSALIRQLISHVGRVQARSPLPVLLLSHMLRPTGELTAELAREAGVNYLACGAHHGITALGRAFAWSRTNRAGALSHPVAPDAGESRPRSEHQALRYLATRGVPVIPGALAKSAEGAVTLAKSFGGAVVLKIASADVAHKTEAGGVVLNLLSDEAVAASYERILESVRRCAPEARVDGVIVSPMRSGGVELFVGIAADPQWGLMLAVGLGGIWVEALQDTVLRCLPVAPAEVVDMLSELRGTRLLEGFRGAPAVDKQAVARVIADIGLAAMGLGPHLVTLEVNPLLASGSHVEALDAWVSWNDSTN